MNSRRAVLVALTAVALAGCGGSASKPKNASITAGDVRSALKTYGVHVKLLARSKDGCVVLIPTAANDFHTYGFFEIDVSQSQACEAALRRGTRDAKGIYWSRSKGTWFGESRIARNIWVQTNGKERRRGSQASYVVRTVRRAVYDVLRARGE